MRRSLIAVLACGLAAVFLVTAPVSAGAAPRRAGAGGAALVAASPGQEPDAPADDGTGASAEDEDENPQPAVPDQNIIPRPNSGHEPTEAGDRGGALQILVFGAIVAGVGTIGLFAARDVRRGRARAASARSGR